jgi:hypothetical protein
MNILDMKVRTEPGMLNNVEMQVSSSVELQKRFTFNVAKLLIEQINKKEERVKVLEDNLENSRKLKGMGIPVE